ncbi:MAG TPA: hypothetical protein VLH85_05125, partial [Levilinea sp.]|nr:hypothetical protein [Levilinea sp.]
LFWFISAPMGQLFRVLEKQELHLWINILIFVTRLASLYAGGAAGSPRLAIIFFSASGVLVYGYMSLAIIHSAGVEWRRITRILVKQALLFLPAGLALAVLTILSANIWLRIGLAALAGLAYYYYILISDPELAGFLAKYPLGRRLGFKPAPPLEGS